MVISEQVAALLHHICISDSLVNLKTGRAFADSYLNFAD